MSKKKNYIFNTNLNYSVKLFLNKQVHVGVKNNVTSTYMSYFFYGHHHNNTILDINKIIYQLRLLLLYIENLVSKNGRILFIGNDVIDLYFLKLFNKKYSQYFLINNWPYGFFTDFDRKKQVFLLKYLKLKESLLNVKSKKKSLLLLKKLKSLKNLLDIVKLPDAVFLTTSYGPINNIIIKESNIKNIPILGFSDNPKNIEYFTYMIPILNNSIITKEFYFKLIELSIKKGLIKSFHSTK